MIADPLDVDMEESMGTPDRVGLAGPVNADIEENSSDGVGLWADMFSVRHSQSMSSVRNYMKSGLHTFLYLNELP